MPKPDIHPTWYPDAKVICNGEVVMTTGSTQPEINVDVWSGNHPFFTGTQKILDTEGRVDRFMRKYGMAGASDAKAAEAKPEAHAHACTFIVPAIVRLCLSSAEVVAAHVVCRAARRRRLPVEEACWRHAFAQRLGRHLLQDALRRGT